LQILAGRDGGWPPNARGDGTMTLSEAWAASRFITLTGLTGAVAAASLVPVQLAWLSPVLAPMILAPVLIAWTSHPSRATGLYATSEELHRPEILVRHDAVMARWRALPARQLPPGLAQP